MDQPILPQRVERCLRQRHGAFVVSFGGPHVQQHPWGIHVAGCQMPCVAGPQSAGVGGTKEDLVVKRAGGFNQLPDDLDLTDSWNYAAAYNHRFSQDLIAGVSSIYRKLETKLEILDISSQPPSSSIQTIEYDDTHADLWLNWTPNLHWALGVLYSYNRYDLEQGYQGTDTGVLVPDGVLRLETHKMPTSISYFHPSGFSTKLTATYFDQQGNFIDRTGRITQQGEDRGLITDLVFSYRLPKRRGSVSLGVNNLFDKRLNFEDRDSYDASNPINSALPSPFAVERVVFGTISLNFR
jgi:hypothetical protein